MTSGIDSKGRARWARAAGLGGLLAFLVAGCGGGGDAPWATPTTPQQAEAWRAALPGGLVEVSVGPGAMGVTGDDLAVWTAWGLQAALDLDTSAPVLIRGADAAQLARVAERLRSAGVRQILAVVSER